MKCIFCNGQLGVVNSRNTDKGRSVWRRKKCNECSRIVTTREKIDLDIILNIEGRPYKRLLLENLLAEISSKDDIKLRYAFITIEDRLIEESKKKIVEGSDQLFISGKNFIGVLEEILALLDEPALLRFKAMVSEGRSFF
jgi:transcriptional regulator NrdR family protein